jgi:hypothetical protein
MRKPLDSQAATGRQFRPGHRAASDYPEWRDSQRRRTLELELRSAAVNIRARQLSLLLAAVVVAAAVVLAARATRPEHVLTPTGLLGAGVALVRLGIQPPPAS